MAGFTLPGVQVQRDPLAGTAQVLSVPLIPALVGLSDGELKIITSESKLKGAKGSLEGLTNTPAESIIVISDTDQGIPDYVENRDFVLNSDQVDWSLNSVLVPPAVITPIVSQTGGVLAADDYFYVVTAIRATDVSIPINVIGETTQSNEVTGAIAAPGTGKITLTWQKVPGALGYKVYRSLDSGVYPDGVPYGSGSLLITVLGVNSTSFTDDGSLTPGAGAPPVTNDACSQPAKGATYFVSYRQRVFDFEPKFFTDLSVIKTKYGQGSQIAKLATLVMGKNGIGNDAPFLWVCAAQDDSDAAFAIAINKFAPKDIQLISYGRSSQSLNIQALQHALSSSTVLEKKERVIIGSAPSGTPIGDINTSGSLLFFAEALRDRRIVLLGSKGDFKAQTEDSVGNLALETLSPAFASVALMGRIVALADPAEPWTNKEVTGFDPTEPVTDEWLESEHLLLISGGVLTLENRGGRLFVKQGITTDNRTIEDFEGSVGLAEDELRRLFRRILDRYVGRKITAGLIRAITNTVKFGFASAIRIGLIAGFDEGTLSVVQDPILKTFINIKAKYEPIYPANVLDFQYGFDFATSGTSGLLQ